MATSIPESAVEEVKARTDIAELVASYGIAIRHSGSSTVACCPFHNEKTPSFHINSAKGFYHCFGCGESGDVIKFVEKQEGLTFVEAVKKLASLCGVEIKEKEDPSAALRKRLYALMAELAEFYHRCLEKMKSAAIAREYLEKRELGPEAQNLFKIGYAPSGIEPILTWAKKYGYSLKELEEAGIVKAPAHPGDKGFHRFGGRLIFSVFDKAGRVVAFSARQLVENKKSGKYVNSPETLIFRKSSVLYAFDKAAANIAKANGREAIVCEGQIDCIRLHISGFPVAVASQGTAFTEEHVRMLSRVADCAALAFDDDAAGHKATIRTARLFLQAGLPVRAVTLPGGDDPDSFLRKHGPEAFRKLLDSAESITSFQFRVESAKESNPGSLDAVGRISKAILETIAVCSNAVLRASMISEASKYLKLPIIALNEELEKTKIALKAPSARNIASSRPAGPGADGELAGERPEGDEDEAPICAIEGEEAAKYIPPPKGEIALVSLIVAFAEDNIAFDMAKNFLPPKILEHDFTKKILAAWLGAKEGSRDEAIEELCDKLDERERAWHDSAMMDSLKFQACGLGIAGIFQNLLRSLWKAYLTRKRGSLSADAKDESEFAEIAKLMEYSRRLQQDRWAKTKDLINELKKGLD